MLSRLELMLHEWESEEKPVPCPPVVFQARQGMMVANWLRRLSPFLSSGDFDIVLQSEHSSPQVAAIREVIAFALDWPVVESSPFSPHVGTQILLEMAMEASSMLTDVSVADVLARQATVDRLTCIGHLFQSHNVEFIVAKEEQPTDNYR